MPQLLFFFYLFFFLKTASEKSGPGILKHGVTHIRESKVLEVEHLTVHQVVVV